jgi:hypothetical protein
MGLFSFSKYTFIIFAAHRLRITDVDNDEIYSVRLKWIL